MSSELSYAFNMDMYFVSYNFSLFNAIYTSYDSFLND